MKRIIAILLLSVVFVLPIHKSHADGEQDIINWADELILQDSIAKNEEKLKINIATFIAGKYWTEKDTESLVDAIKQVAKKKTPAARKELKETLFEIRKTAQKEIYSIKETLEKEIALANKYGFKTKEAKEIYADIKGFTGGTLTIELDIEGKKKSLDILPLNEEERTAAAPTIAPVKEANVKLPCDDDYGDGSGKNDSYEKTGGVREWASTILPITVAAGAMLAGGVELRQQRDNERHVRHLLTDAMNKGQSPYALMPMYNSVLNRNALRSTADILAASMFALQYGNGSGKSSNDFAKYYEQRARQQRMQELLRLYAQRQGNGSMSSNSTQTVQWQQRIDAIKNLANMFPRGDELFDNYRKQIEQARQQMFGGMSQRQIQDMMTATSNLASGMNAFVQTQQQMDQIFDEVGQRLAQGRQLWQNLDQNINGQGGITHTMTRTRNNTGNWNYNSNMQGNPGIGYMNGNPMYGGQYYVPNSGTTYGQYPGQGFGAQFNYGRR